MTNKTFRVLVFEPGKHGEVREIPHGLEALQGIVGGYVEAVYMIEPRVGFYANEDGRQKKLPNNVMLPNGTMLVGTVFVARVKGSEFVSLTAADIARYQNYHHQRTPAPLAR